MRIGNPTPIFRIFDEAKAREFYLDFLGFVVDWEHRFEPGMPLYMQVRRDDMLLHLTEHHGDATPGASLRVNVGDVDTYHKEITAREYGYARPGVKNQPWNSRDMTITDPFGNKLTFFSIPDEEATK